MTADEIRADILEFIRALQGRDPRELKAWFLLAQSFVGAAHEIAAQLAELNAQVGKGRFSPIYVLNPQSGSSPSYPCSVCSLVFYSDGALKSHFSDAHERRL
jgi:hypothetical protein